jgi:shikimate dehydrogenase
MLSTETVHTIDELSSWPKDGQWLAVLGHPIQHSLSPFLHNSTLDELKTKNPDFLSWRYFKFDIDPGQLKEALDAFKEAGFVGLNLTVPHKVLAFGLVPRISEEARPIGAINTLRRVPGLGWEGHNTDSFGFAQALRADLKFDLRSSRVIILGAGGAARGAAFECLRQGVSELWIANRTAATLDRLISDLRPNIQPGTALHGFDPTQPCLDLPEGAAVINSTSLGLKAGDPAAIDLSKLPRPAVAFDMVYSPPVTAFLAQAASLGIPHCNGLSMLAFQAVRALSLWTGASFEQLGPPMLAAARRTLHRDQP